MISVLVCVPAACKRTTLTETALGGNQCNWGLMLGLGDERLCLGFGERACDSCDPGSCPWVRFPCNGPWTRWCIAACKLGRACRHSPYFCEAATPWCRSRPIRIRLRPHKVVAGVVTRVNIEPKPHRLFQSAPSLQVPQSAASNITAWLFWFVTQTTNAASHDVAPLSHTQDFSISVFDKISVVAPSPVRSTSTQPVNTLSLQE